MSTQPKVILVFGATGNIGRALIEELSSSTDPAAAEFQLVALSRNVESSTSRRLAALPRVVVKQIPDNGMDKPAEAIAALGYQKGDVYGVFSCQGYVSAAVDTAQGIAIADLCVTLGVSHLVYLSTNFGGVSDTGTDIFECKRKVENHIFTLSPLKHTILRPAQFMDNLLPTAPTFLALGRTMLLCHTFQTHPQRKHQMVSTRDIGIAGARAFEEPDKHKIVDLAGDEITMDELKGTYLDVMGQKIETPLGLKIATWFGRKVVPPVKGVADFFDRTGYNVDIAQCRQKFPQIETLRQFFERNKGKTA